MDTSLTIINPGSRTEVYQGLASEYTAIEPPVWAGMLASYASYQGFNVDLIDANAHEYSPQDCVDILHERPPNLVVIPVYGHQPNASTQNMPAAIRLCQEVKRQTSIPVLMLGGHVATLPVNTLLESGADFVCDGEGFLTIPPLVSSLVRGVSPNDVPDLWFMHGMLPVHTGVSAKLVTELDTHVAGLPWDDLPMHLYRAHNWHAFTNDMERQPYASVYTTLGCPYRCTFCPIQAPFKKGEAAGGQRPETNSYRRWSPSVVVDQLEDLHAFYDVRNIKIADEMFVLHKGHVEAICLGIIERGLDLNIWAYARVDTVTKPLLALLKRAGFNWLAYGIESGNEAVRASVDKGVDHHDIWDAVQNTQDAGINVMGNFIFGLPEDTNDSMDETIDMALDMRPEFANFYSAMAYPGSQLYLDALDEGWKLPDTWGGYSQHSVDTTPLPTRTLSGKEVLEVRDHAFDAFFRDPRYLNELGQKFGPEAVAHVQEMAAVKLVRSP